MLTLFQPWHEISNNVVCATSKASDQPALTRSLISAFACRLYILTGTPLTEHNLELVSFQGGCTGLSESTLVKMPQCWKSHYPTHFMLHLLTCIICNLEVIG